MAVGCKAEQVEQLALGRLTCPSRAHCRSWSTPLSGLLRKRPLFPAYSALHDQI